LHLLTRPFALALGTAAGAALAIAFILQYGFGFEPCNLCIWERWPWLVVILASLGGVLAGRPQLGLAVAVLALLFNAGLSTFHVGVEQGLFALPESCAAAGQATSLEQLKAQLAAAPPRCDQLSIAWLGLSLAAWNGLASLGAALLTIAVLVRDFRLSNSSIPAGARPAAHAGWHRP
jgi:disulfide bond formation protein DsbB